MTVGGDNTRTKKRFQPLPNKALFRERTSEDSRFRLSTAAPLPGSDSGGLQHVSALHPILLFDLDIQPTDFLVKRGQRHVESLSRFGLVPVAALEHVGDDAPLHIIDDLEQ
jgi:hypothetical protein